LKTRHQGDRMSLLKMAQDVAQPNFCQYECLLPWKKWPNDLEYVSIFKKKMPKENNRQKAKIRPIWVRCYDHNFLLFVPIFGGNLAFFSKTNVMITFLHNLAFF
jgi:hypothetical protein